MLAGLTTAQIGDWSDSGWSNAQYDRLYSQQNAALDVAKRVDLVHQMQAIIYKEAPYIALVYPQGREVYDTQHWTGWVKMPSGNGSVDNRWTYLSVGPQTTVAATSSGARGVWVAVVAVVVVIALGGLWVVRRRRSARIEAD